MGVVFRDFQPHALAIEETPPSPFTAILLWSLVGLLIAAVTWAYASHIPIMTTAPGKFVTGAHTKVVQSFNSGMVRAIFVKAGNAVMKGQVLVTLDPAVNLAKLTAARKDLHFNRIQQLRLRHELGLHGDVPSRGETAPEMVSLEKHVAISQLASERSKLGADRAQVREAAADLAAGNAMLTEYVAKAAQDSQLARSAHPLVPEGAVSGEEYVQLEDQAIVDEGQLRAERQQVRQLSAAVVAAQHQLQEDAYTFQADRYDDLEASVGKSYDLRSQYAQTERDAAEDKLRAPVDGTVQTLEVASLGTVVQPGQTVATIVPAQAALVVEVDLPAQDVGFIKIGQRTEIKVTAYPFEQYGSIPGKIIWISPTSESTSNLVSAPEGESHQAPSQPTQSSTQPGADQDKNASPPTLYYRIKVLPARAWIEVQGQRLQIRSGMTVSVDIETGRRRVLDFFLDPIVKYVSNGLVVR